MIFLDKLINAITGQGTSKDKASHSTRVFAPMSSLELLTCYRDSRLAANIVDMPAQDATKEGRQWSATKDEITKIEAEEKRLNLNGRLFELIQMSRLTGAGYLYMATGDANLMDELKPEKYGAGSLRFLALFDKTMVAGYGDRNRDPESEWFNRYEWYRVQTGNTMNPEMIVHASRMVHISGVKVPYVREATQTNDDQGDSVLNSIMRTIDGVDSTMASAMQMVFEGKIDILAIPDLMARMSGAGAKEYESQVFNRLTAFSMAKGVHGVGVIDANEKFESKTTNFSGVSDVITLIWQFLAAEAGPVPMTKLFGMSPGGMNATGEYDSKNYQDWITTFQTMVMDPACTRLFEMLIRSALGDRPEELYYTWRDISKPDTKTLAEVGDKMGNLLDKLDKMNLFPEPVMASLVVNTMTEYGILPGFEGTLNSWFDENGINPDDGDAFEKMLEEVEPDVDPDETGALPGQPATTTVAANDMAPRPLYVSRKVLNAKEILEHYADQGLDLYEPEELHVTIIYSREAVDWIEMGQAWDEEITVTGGGPRVMALFGHHLVLQFAHSGLQWRNRVMQERGASYDFDEYLPHISIAENFVPELGQNVERDIEPYRGRILLGPEIFEDIKDDR